MQATLVYFCAIAAVASARMAFRFAAGIEEILGNIDNSFSCDDKPYGFYADPQNDCRVFHVCSPVPNEEGEVVSMDHFSFVCGNETIFNQESLTCTRVDDAVPCEEAPSLYEIVNAEFGRILQSRQDSEGGFSQDEAIEVPQNVIQEEFIEGDLETSTNPDYDN